MFRNLFSKIFKAIGSLNTSSNYCWRVIIDEPEMPKSIIER
ncbi:MAG: cyclic lactone autoinducer peptide [Bacilli bacterium]|nr:cyclic lactone autoinducer peptide [Bacilli bacterium]